MSYDMKAPGGGSGDKPDPKVVEFLQQQAAQQQLLQQIEKISETCWDLCDISMRDRLDGKQETCLTNCSQRYFDVANFVANRFMQKVQQTKDSLG